MSGRGLGGEPRCIPDRRGGSGRREMGNQKQVGAGSPWMAAEAWLNMWGTYTGQAELVSVGAGEGQVSEVCLWSPGPWPRLPGAYL